MATAAEAGMVAGSNVVSGAGTSSRSFTLPASPLYRVESVVAHVDNTAGGDTTATLTYADTNGEVIAKKPQGGTITAGTAAGTATFALRLDDSAAAARGATIKSASYSGSNVNILAGATGTILWDSFDAGDDLLNLTVPAAPTVRTAGFYIVTSLVDCHTGGISFRQDFSFTSAGPGSAAAGLTGDLGGLGATGLVTLTIAAQLAAGDALLTTVLNQGGLAANFNELQGSVARIT